MSLILLQYLLRGGVGALYEGREDVVDIVGPVEAGDFGGDMGNGPFDLRGYY